MELSIATVRRVCVKMSKDKMRIVHIVCMAKMYKPNMCTVQNVQFQNV